MTSDDWTNIGLVLGLLYDRFVSLEPHGVVSARLMNTAGKPAVSFETHFGQFHAATNISLSLLSELPAATIAQEIGELWLAERSRTVKQ